MTATSLRPCSWRLNPGGHDPDSVFRLKATTSLEGWTLPAPMAYLSANTGGEQSTAAWHGIVIGYVQANNWWCGDYCSYNAVHNTTCTVKGMQILEKGPGFGGPGWDKGAASPISSSPDNAGTHHTTFMVEETAEDNGLWKKQVVLRMLRAPYGQLSSNFATAQLVCRFFVFLQFIMTAL